MFALKIVTKAKKDLKKLKKTSIDDFNTATNFITDLLNVGFKGVEPQYKPHKLTGDYKNCYECHIKPDLLLIWQEMKTEINIIEVIRIGSHSELF